MYSYSYDPKTGGILLNPSSSDGKMSKEPRPVYAAELDLLGFGDVWKYDAQNEAPYMWAEANVYYYRGRKVANLKGGNLYEAPEIVLEKDENGVALELEPKGRKLRPVDLKKMIAANAKTLEIIENATVKKIKNVYEKRRGKLDCFHVAFSGGKDSVVLLDLVRKTLPRDGYVVLFADTGMEFPDTLETVEATRRACEADGVAFHIARSRMTPEESWAIFGPPSRVLRWCCSVHKSAPQTLKLREITRRVDYTGLDFVGVRRHESLRRFGYDEENFGKKQKGQYSHNSILDWTSAEVWLYLYANDLPINAAYKKGLARAGCLFCPMSSGANEYVRRARYQKEVDFYVDAIRSRYDAPEDSDEKRLSYVLNGGWNARKNGRDLNNNVFRCLETTCDGALTIRAIAPTSDWREWIKTLGHVRQIGSDAFTVDYDRELIEFSLRETDGEIVVKIPETALKERPAFSKQFRQVFRKAAYCVGCDVCASNCHQGAIRFVDNKIQITDCIGCRECHEIDSGCLLFHSLRHPQGGGVSVKKTSLNSFADHAPQIEWLQSFFALENKFFTEHSLGPNQFSMFGRFLRDSELCAKKEFTSFAALAKRLDWKSETAQGLILINLVARNPQFEWYVRNLDVGTENLRERVEQKLIAADVKIKDAKSICKAFKRVVETPMGTNLKFGRVDRDADKTEVLTRTKCVVSEPLVVLYGLFKFAEKCGDYKQFRLSVLLDDSVERDGVSPTRIFGLEREEMIPILNGLTAKFPEFIYASFTHDLEKISLADDKTSADVLRLF